MSADVWIEEMYDAEAACCSDPPSPFPVRASSEITGHQVNITYNLSPMLREAGMPAWKDFMGAPCSESGGVFARTAANLRADPDRFRAMNPENGWGSYEQAVEVIEALARMCSTHPDCHIGGWL